MKRLAYLFTILFVLSSHAAIVPILTVDLTNYWAKGSTVILNASGWNNSTTASNTLDVLIDGNFLFSSQQTAGRSNIWSMYGILRFDGTNLSAMTQYYSGDTNDPFELQSLTLTNFSIGTNIVTFAMPGGSDTNFTFNTPNFAPSVQLPGQSSSITALALVQGSSAAVLVMTNGILQTLSKTVTNSTDSTFGYAAGLLTWDTNYLYVSVGTNLWKRVALNTW